MFDHFAGLALKELNILIKILLIINYNHFHVLDELTQYIKNFFSKLSFNDPLVLISR